MTHSPEYYRAEAERCRNRAQAAADPVTIKEWTRVAAECDLIALDLETVPEYDRRGRAAKWRDLANRLRAFAKTTDEPLAEDTLNSVIREWERLANRLERRGPLGPVHSEPDQR